MTVVQSFLGSLLSPFLVSDAFWVVKLNGRLYSERDMVRTGGIAESGHPLTIDSKRPFDWTLDLCNGPNPDILRVKELWLICPPSAGYPLGQTAKLPIVEPGTAFQFKVAYLDGDVGGTMHTKAHQIIGRVTDKVSGDCECFIWDVGLGKLGTYNTNVYTFGSWRPEIGPISALSHDVLGLRLA